ncbi:MAG: hypothetical protein ACREA4_08485, partial [Nitrososphaera sp.]
MTTASRQKFGIGYCSFEDMRSVMVHELVGKIRHFHSLKQSVCAVVFRGHACEMEVQSEHVTTEKDEIQVMQKVTDLAK